MTTQGKVFSTKIKRTNAGEYVVRAYDHSGARLPDSDYHTADKADAQATATIMVLWAQGYNDAMNDMGDDIEDMRTRYRNNYGSDYSAGYRQGTRDALTCEVNRLVVKHGGLPAGATILADGTYGYATMLPE